MKNIQDIRSRISILRNECDALRAQHRSRNEVRAHVERQLVALRAEGQRLAARHLVVLAYSGELPQLFTAHGAGLHANLAPALASVHDAERLEAFLLAGIDEIPEGLDPAAKVVRLDAIEAELYDLETREEALIVQSEGGDHPIARRLDARPEIVLALQP